MRVLIFLCKNVKASEYFMAAFSLQTQQGQFWPWPSCFRPTVFRSVNVAKNLTLQFIYNRLIFQMWRALWRVQRNLSASSRLPSPPHVSPTGTPQQYWEHWLLVHPPQHGQQVLWYRRQQQQQRRPRRWQRWRCVRRRIGFRRIKSAIAVPVHAR